MTFRDLPIGAEFVFACDEKSGALLGPWRKISPRKYRHVCDTRGKYSHQVGTVKAEVRLREEA